MSVLAFEDEYSPMISVGFPSQVDIAIGLQNPRELQHQLFAREYEIMMTVNSSNPTLLSMHCDYVLNIT
jgi:hypothetical protein